MIKLLVGANFRIDTRTLDLEPLFTKGTMTLQGATFFRIEIAPGTFTDIKGSFQYSSTGGLVSGSITQIKHYSEGRIGFILSEIYLSVQSFLDAARDPKKGYPMINIWDDEFDFPVLKGSDKGDVLFGSYLYDNLIDGKGGADIMWGSTFEGNDRYIVDVAADRVIDGYDEFGGTDTVYAECSYALREEAGAIEVLKAITATATTALNFTGNSYDNTVKGNNGRNILRGKDGEDNLLGLGGDDVLIGGNGCDELAGGAGKDVFVFDTILDDSSPRNNHSARQDSSRNVDRIRDFNVADDRIHLKSSIFTALTTKGTLDPSAFAIGSAATKPDQHIINNYDATKDKYYAKLYYDPDGSGPQAAVLFAELLHNPSITSSHFLVI